MDLYYVDSSERDGFRREVLRIEAGDDATAIEEAKRADGWRRSSFYRIRAIRGSTRSGDVLIYDTQAATEALAESVIVIADNPDSQSVPSATVSENEAGEAGHTPIQAEAMT
jgi:hypothetical protein